MELKDLDLESAEGQEIELCTSDREELICLYLEYIYPDNVVFVEFRKDCAVSSAPKDPEIAMVEVIEKLEKERLLSANWLRQILREIIEAEELRSKKRDTVS